MWPTQKPAAPVATASAEVVVAATKASLSKLTLLASALSTAQFTDSAAAQTPPREHAVRMQYSYYKDWQSGSEDRMTVRAPQFLYTGPVAENTALEIGFVYDAVSGASPLYHDTLTGASGIGIKDNRRAADVKLTQFWETFSIGLGGNFSNEDDYDSLGASVDVQTWNKEKSTVWSFGVGGHDDEITSSNDSELDESSQNLSYLAGVTQTINKFSLFQVNLTYASSDGYLTDPYKLSDLRPRSRDEWAILGRYVRNIESCGSALHLDYRYFFDTWGIDSHLLELKYYRPITESFTIRPLLRYYTQDKADFYDTSYPPPDDVINFYTTDQRLSGFGALGAGLAFIYDWGDGYTTDLSAEYEHQQGSLRAFGQGSPGIKNFNELLVSLGVEKKF